MASFLTFDIEFEATASPRAPGDAVRGRVRVVPDETVECRRLEVECRWRTAGHHDLETGGGGRRVLLRDVEWEAEQLYTEPFEFDVASPGPYSFDGEIAQIAWVVEARARVPWAVDGTTSAAFEVTPSGAETTYRAGATPLDEARRKYDEGIESPRTGCTPFLWGVAFWIPVWSVALLAGPARLSYGLWLFLMGIGLLGLGLSGLAVWTFVSDTFFHPIDLRVHSREATPGDLVAAGVRIPKPLRRWTEAVSVELVRTEEVASRRSSRSIEETVVERRIEMPNSGLVPVEDGDELLRIPESVGYSHWTSDQEVEWVLRLKVESGLPLSWRTETGVLIRPELKND